MRITFRFIAALVLAASMVVAISTYFQIRSEKDKLRQDLDRRGAILAGRFEEVDSAALSAPNRRKLERVVGKYGGREGLIALAVYDAGGNSLASFPATAPELDWARPLVHSALGSAAPASKMLETRHLYAVPIRSDGQILGVLTIIRDASFIQARLWEMGWHNFFRLLLHALLISLVSLLIIRWNILAPIDQMARWMKQIRAGETVDILSAPGGILAPLASEANQLVRSLASARAAAEEEARLRQRAQSLWTAERLKEYVKEKLGGRPLFVVANREPYMHVRQGKKIQVIVPASGLVTGIEPILRACGGMWIGHGAGDADRETVDEHDRIAVPPDEPQYTLKRVWLSSEEEAGYYYGFSNEGLWPLCHIAHTRPIFREEDWRHYQAANEKFAEALAEELRGTEEPCVLVQDYHFALLPRLIKQRRPDARVALFWHIPWPNPEAFGICPWQRELLDGMLGADLVGFHIQFHCNNFLETVDRTLESRIDWERFAVQRRGHMTLVKPLPISIAFPDPAVPLKDLPDKGRLLQNLGVKAPILGVGVDRVDYTKGIVERFRAIERFLERYPVYAGRVVFVELGAPSRTRIKRYQDHMTEVELEAERINQKFKGKDYRPIVLLNTHHSHAEIEPFYRAADFCMVTSLADGMNLVAKEFVASRADESGVLILSRFTGAAWEMRDAVIVNPYDTGRTADAIRAAIEMAPEEQTRRMANLRGRLKEQNIYFWAARLIEELTAIRLPASRSS
ncbi:MAG: trehalose-6-phosphate synthase [Elusimicrobia bacterium]|nr:trehalose-6-phosphate synthase [Elusimicrobiota bacterium]